MDEQHFGQYLRESVGDIGYELVEPVFYREISGCPHHNSWLMLTASGWYCTVCGHPLDREEVMDRKMDVRIHLKRRK